MYHVLGKGGHYRSFDKVLEIPAGYFSDVSDWSKLALMRNRRTLEELERLRRSAVDPDAIGRMIPIIENVLGYLLYDAVEQMKRALSSDVSATFRFESGDLEIERRVTRRELEDWLVIIVSPLAAS